ncbi:YbgA family protein [Marinobacterium jannaschii]|uniref:YbgA family protein n=1 Tax=Marinobacterium jannaschii TaxID=64970 RepID=UPI0004813969|nr:DUF523 and DUF1722 domain-containing protein [Marinobacterium jannaschii]
MEMTHKIPVGISACLTGQKVRFNGGHKQSRYCLDVLSDCFDFMPFCPEVAVGLGVPRQPIRLVGDVKAPRAVGTNDPSLDVTEGLLAHGRRVGNEMAELCGYVVIKGSPSCGYERVKIYQENNYPAPGGGRGLFVQGLMETNPVLPIEEEGRLNDPVLRENFITRVFAFYSWKQAVEADPSYHNLLEFHACNKYLLMAHSYDGYKQLGRFLAEAHEQPLEDAMAEYIRRFMAYIGQPAERKTHVNVLMHMMGYMKKALDSECKQELLESIEQYRRGEVHLVVPLTMLKHYLKRHGSEYILNQAYLDPHPHQLGLRNYI